METQNDQIHQTQTSEPVSSNPFISKGNSLIILFRSLGIFILIGDVVLAMVKLRDMGKPQYYSPEITFDIGPELFVSALFAVFLFALSSILEMLNDVRAYLHNIDEKTGQKP